MTNDLHLQSTFELVEKNLIDSSKIFLYSDVDDESAERTIARMKYIALVLNRDVVYLYINSDGGDVNSGNAIIDEIIGLKKQKIKVYTIATGRAYSCAADILSFGSERYATKNCGLMLHPLMFESSIDYVSQQERYNEFMKKQWNILSSLVAKNCGYSTKKEIKEFQDKVKDGLWMTADEAIDFGLIDGIWEYKWEKEEI